MYSVQYKLEYFYSSTIAFKIVFQLPQTMIVSKDKRNSRKRNLSLYDIRVSYKVYKVDVFLTLFIVVGNRCERKWSETPFVGCTH